MARFSGKTAIVTGAASGIGRATAVAFAKEGANVIAADKSPNVHETAAIIAEAGGAVFAVEMDAGSEADVNQLAQTAMAKYGQIDVLFANAGIVGSLLGILDHTEKDFVDVLRVNLIGPFLAIKAVAPFMVAGGGGSIICTASVAGIRSGAGGAAYAASKAGVINLVQIAAQQLAGSGVRVNAVCPGLIETGMTQFLYDNARAKGKEGQIGSLNPLRRGGEPEELASAVLFLASDEASYVNGHAMVVDGGLSSSHPYNRQEFGKCAT
jgi:NAD(P)-dependent dehydrogenase (short-subunit alcohol dehydrogenase family)